MTGGLWNELYPRRGSEDVDERALKVRVLRRLLDRTHTPVMLPFQPEAEAYRAILRLFEILVEAGGTFEHSPLIMTRCAPLNIVIGWVDATIISQASLAAAFERVPGHVTSQPVVLEHGYLEVGTQGPTQPIEADEHPIFSLGVGAAHILAFQRWAFEAPSVDAPTGVH